MRGRPSGGHWGQPRLHLEGISKFFKVYMYNHVYLQKRYISQGEQNGANFNFVAPSGVEL